MQPQWPPGNAARPHHYTHSQPQWFDVLADPNNAPDSGVPPVCRSGTALAPTRLCTSCSLAKEECICTRCAVCTASVGRGTRHHCRCCWRTVCSGCWTRKRYVFTLGQPMRVCDRCAVPSALANLHEQEEKGLSWGLYLLRSVGEMPSLCVAPHCGVLTYHAYCYRCGTPTVMTQPHLQRVLRVDGSKLQAVDHVRLLDIQQMSHRAAEVDGYPTTAVEEIFRRSFPRYEDLLFFRLVTSPQQSHNMLLSVVCAGIAYEFSSAPNLTLQLSDIPYARLLKVLIARPRYTILEAPGRVKFVAFPGTHNWRTVAADLRIGQVTKTVLTSVIEGVRVDPQTGQHTPVNSGTRTVWEYKLHGGFTQEAQEVGLPMEELVEDVRQGYRLVFSGHSLGGAIGQLLTIQMLARYPELQVTSLPAGTPPPLLCVSLGAPLVGNYQLEDRVGRSGWGPHFHNIVYRTDVVPRLSCGDELTWDAAWRVADRITGAYRSVQNWWTGWNVIRGSSPGGDASAMPKDADGLMAVPDGCTVEGFVDSAIRTGRVVLSEGEDHAPTAQELVERQRTLQADLQHHSPQKSAVVGDAALAAALAAPSRRQHRRFACFGRYHFLQFGDSGYVSTADSETAFGLLKAGCGVATDFTDHSISAYNRGVMMHLYSRK